jgi:hypothetical protein
MPIDPVNSREPSSFEHPENKLGQGPSKPFDKSAVPGKDSSNSTNPSGSENPKLKDFYKVVEDFYKVAGNIVAHNVQNQAEAGQKKIDENVKKSETNAKSS